MFNFLKAGAKPEVKREKREKKRKKSSLELNGCVVVYMHLTICKRMLRCF
jgi:hypothetical protein